MSGFGDPAREARPLIGGDAEPQDPSAANTHDQQPVEKPERGGRHDE
jgi:hypothetical protein